MLFFLCRRQETHCFIMTILHMLRVYSAASTCSRINYRMISKLKQSKTKKGKLNLHYFPCRIGSLLASESVRLSFSVRVGGQAMAVCWSYFYDGSGTRQSSGLYGQLAVVLLCGTQLVAVYGLCSSLSVLVFCALIGSLVDRWPRLTAASVFLAVQNCAVCVTCLVVSLHLLVSCNITLHASHLPLAAGYGQYSSQVHHGHHGHSILFDC